MLVAIVLTCTTAVVGVTIVGARRTQTSLRRAAAAGAFHDVGLAFDGLAEPPSAEAIDRITHLPEVRAFGAFSAKVVAVVGADGARRVPEQGELIALAPLDNNFGVTIDRSRLLEGHAPDPRDPLQVVVNEGLARQRGLRPGGTFDITGVSLADGERLFGGEAPLLEGPVLHLRVTGIVRHVFDTAGTSGAPKQLVVLTPAFEQRFGADNVGFDQGPFFLLKRGGQDVDAFERRVRTILGNPSGLGVSRRSDEVASAEDNLRVQALALALFGLAVLLMSVVVLGSAMVRQTRAAEPAVNTAVALGATYRRAAAAATLPAVAATAVATVAGTAIAVASSSLMPTGQARRIEPHPGLAANLAVLASCAAAEIVLVGAVVLASALFGREKRSSSPTTVPTALSSRAARLGAPLPVVVGVQLLADPAGGRRVNARTAIIGTLAATAAVATSLTFGAALAHLLDTPRVYGWDFDAAVEADDVPQAAEAASQIPGVDGVSEYRKVPVDIGGTSAEAIAVDTSRASVFPTVVGGRLPAQSDEVLLGAKTKRRLGVGDGDVVTLRAGRSATFQVVGTAALVTTDSDQVGTGAVLSSAALDRLEPDEGVVFHSLFVRYDGDADRAAVERALSDLGDVVRPVPTSDVANLSSARNLPLVLALLLGALAVAVLAHALLLAVRTRGTDLAVLRSLGFLRRQTALVVVVQALSLAMVAAAIGTPVGVIAGRGVWDLVATSLGVKLERPIPALGLVAAAAAVAGIAVLVSLVPARRAMRRRPSEVLRAE